MLSTETRENLKCGLRDRLTKEAARNKIVTLFPDEGPLRQELYVKHFLVEFQERCFMAANRVGKSVVGAYETTQHLTDE